MLAFHSPIYTHKRQTARWNWWKTFAHCPLIYELGQWKLSVGLLLHCSLCDPAACWWGHYFMRSSRGETQKITQWLKSINLVIIVSSQVFCRRHNKEVATIDPAWTHVTGVAQFRRLKLLNSISMHTIRHPIIIFPIKSRIPFRTSRRRHFPTSTSLLWGYRDGWMMILLFYSIPPKWAGLIPF